tara:strand:+ start:1009 stop:2166 length:1158 start_codon:yes stop_codon:yes gene_type:complete
MKKQKICIIGTGLTGLITALSLSKLNLNIDLIGSDFKQNLSDNRTLAISEDNLNFFKEKILIDSKKIKFWPCSKIELYKESKKDQFTKLFELKKNNRQMLYMIKNSHLIKYVFEKIKKSNSIKLVNKRKVSEIRSSGLLKSIKFKNFYNKYNLIIMCTGHKSDLVKKTFNDQSMKYSYDEISQTTILTHKALKNNIARQIFFNNKILAFLPISNFQTSIVLSIKKKFFKKNTSVLKKELKFYSKKFLENIKFNQDISIYDLNFFLREKYYNDRILLFGESLHVIHPLAGQGFNMTIRDLKSLRNTIENKINLGLDIGSSDTLLEFSDKTKSKNFLYSMGINLLRDYFYTENKNLRKLGDKAINTIGTNKFAKNIIYNFANRGLNF